MSKKTAASAQSDQKDETYFFFLALDFTIDLD